MRKDEMDRLIDQVNIILDPLREQVPGKYALITREGLVALSDNKYDFDDLEIKKLTSDKKIMVIKTGKSF